MDVDGDALRRAARGAQGGPRPRREGHRPRRGGPQGPRRRVQGDRPGGHRPRLPDRPERAARPRDQGGLRVAGSASARNDYRDSQKIAHDLGTAVNVVTMVFGNMGDDSGHRRRLHPRPEHRRASVLYGEYLTNAQGEDVVAGVRTAPKIAQMAHGHARGLRRVPADRPAARDATTATSRTSSSRSSAASSTCSRRARPSGPPRPP